MPQRDDERVAHMLVAARKAVAFATGKTRAHLDSDEIGASALVHWIQVIGEAARGVSETARERAPGVPWRAIVGMRHVLGPDYDRIDLDLLWATIEKDLPPLVAALEELHRRLSAAPPTDAK